MAFLCLVETQHKQLLQKIVLLMENGEPLNRCLKMLGLSDIQLAQIQFAEIHGDFAQTLLLMTKQMKQREKNKEKLRKMLIYPLFLVLFIGMLLIGMKVFLTPKIEELSMDQPQSKEMWLLNLMPWLALGFLVTLVVFLFLFWCHIKRKSAIDRALILTKTPILGNYLKHYYTSLFGVEWGHLLAQGMEIRDVIFVMSRSGYTPLMQEMSGVTKRKIERGFAMSRIVQDWQFLNAPLLLIIQKGEVSGALGEELVIYGMEEWRQLTLKMERLIECLQPFVFMLIACLIIYLYASLLLPVYQGMEGMI